MSTQAKQLNDVPTVDIGPSTRILALDSSGAVGKGTLAETVGRCGKSVELPSAEQGDWWRIANINFCGVGIICIRELWSQSSPRPVVLGVALDAYPGGNSANNNGIKVLAGESNRISKIRFVVDVPNKANDGWLDICIPHTDKYKSRRTQIASYGLGIRPVELAEAPSVDNAHFVKEFDMTTLQSNSGGVTYCPISLKGGVRHEYGEETERGRTDSSAAEYAVAKRSGVRHRHSRSRGIRLRRKCSKYPLRSQLIRDTDRESGRASSVLRHCRPVRAYYDTNEVEWYYEGLETCNVAVLRKEVAA